MARLPSLVTLFGALIADDGGAPPNTREDRPVHWPARPERRWLGHATPAALPELEITPMGSVRSAAILPSEWRQAP